jgi:hypothetical protein
MSVYYIPFLLQAGLMAADEFYFHEKRGLPAWERIGHPLDTLFTGITLSVPALFLHSPETETIYGVLAIFSCLLITKDEFIHADYCTKTEHWIHSMLFILHPLTFISAYLLWVSYPEDLILRIQPSLIGIFMFYQIFRWSIPWSRLPR